MNPTSLLTSMDTSHMLALTVAVALLCAIFLRRRNRHGVPPGPPALPLIGNLHQLAPSHQHLKFTEWAAKYGNIVYARLLRQPVIILSSASDAVELLDKRGARYSSRPHFAYLIDLVGWKAGTPWMPYDSTWKLHRKWMQHSIMSKAAISNAQQIQRRESHQLLLDLLESPAEFQSHMKRYVVAVIFEIGYGRTISSVDDDFIRLVDQGVNDSLSGSSTGGAIVDMFPILRFLPAWFPGPGAESRRMAERSRRAIRAVETIPYDQVRREMAAGTARPSMVKAVVEGYLKDDGALTEEIECQVKGAAGTLYVGATETSLTALFVCMFQFMVHPEILRKAQAEIDRVVGTARLPDFADKPSLPYIQCIVREVFRFFPPVPLGVMHLAAEDDVYRGYHIPKGCSMVANIWAMLHDAALYPDAEVFRPERFEGVKFEGDAALRDPATIVFGFGRRACPGRAVGESNVWLAVARLAATMDVRRAVGPGGEEIAPEFRYRSGIVNYPEPFSCRITPRSERARQLILGGGDGM